MLDEYKDRIEEAKNRQYMLLDRFHIGDIVYPFWMNNFYIYGTVIDVDTVTRMVTCDFNGVMRQFYPMELMHVNPLYAGDAKKNGSKTAAMRPRHASEDVDNGVKCKCKLCGGDVAVSYNEKTATTDFVCTSCGHRIPEGKLSDKTKKAMRRQVEKSIIKAAKNEDKSFRNRIACELLAVSKDIKDFLQK